MVNYNFDWSTYSNCFYPREIWTHDLLITRRLLNHCATTVDPNLAWLRLNLGAKSRFVRPLMETHSDEFFDIFADFQSIWEGLDSRGRNWASIFESQKIWRDFKLWRKKLWDFFIKKYLGRNSFYHTNFLRNYFIASFNWIFVVM